MRGSRTANLLQHNRGTRLVGRRPEALVIRPGNGVADVRALVSRLAIPGACAHVGLLTIPGVDPHPIWPSLDDIDDHPFAVVHGQSIPASHASPDGLGTCNTYDFT